jgi:hypothetical protein
VEAQVENLMMTSTAKRRRERETMKLACSSRINVPTAKYACSQMKHGQYTLQASKLTNTHNGTTSARATFVCFSKILFRQLPKQGEPHESRQSPYNHPANNVDLVQGMPKQLTAQVRVLATSDLLRKLFT